jgi:hypothetical protein
VDTDRLVVEVVSRDGCRLEHARDRLVWAPSQMPAPLTLDLSRIFAEIE